MRPSILYPIVLAFSLVACTPTPPASTVVRYSSDADFETVRDEVKNAILVRGLVIDNTSYIGKMLDRTRKDVGSDKVVYHDAHAEAFSFCSATVSRQTMEASPHNIVFCPYTIAVYSTAAEPKKTYVAFRRPVARDPSEASRAALGKVENLLDGIAREALQIKEEKK